jgi:hypothetical protein
VRTPRPMPALAPPPSRAQAPDLIPRDTDRRLIAKIGRRVSMLPVHTTSVRQGLGLRSLFITFGLGIALVACGSDGGGGTGGAGGHATGGSTGTGGAAGRATGGSTGTGGAGGHAGTTGGTAGAGGQAGTTGGAGGAATGGAGGAATGGAAGGATGGAAGGAAGAAGGAAGSSAGGAGGAPCGANMVALTVKNYLSWCNVEAPTGSTGSTAAEQVVCVQANGTIDLTATAASATFEVTADDWHDVTSQQLTGSNMTSRATKAVAGTATCVWVCCPFANGTGCPAADQCP